MKKNWSFIFLLLLITLFIFSCKPQVQRPQKFDKEQWALKKENVHPYRNSMLKDLMNSYDLHGVNKDSVFNLLGSPDRSDNGYLFYGINCQQIGLFTLHTKTLVIKLKPDSTVEWLKIHQ
ncbi:MAG TPA: hypothetical protein VFT78_09560 [Hanamia sp.]|nr:hypothetical protein [Hanamia sp.]